MDEKSEKAPSVSSEFYVINKSQKNIETNNDNDISDVRGAIKFKDPIILESKNNFDEPKDTEKNNENYSQNKNNDESNIDEIDSIIINKEYINNNENKKDNEDNEYEKDNEVNYYEKDNEDNEYKKDKNEDNGKHFDKNNSVVIDKYINIKVKESNIDNSEQDFIGLQKLSNSYLRKDMPENIYEDKKNIYNIDVNQSISKRIIDMKLNEKRNEKKIENQKIAKILSDYTDIYFENDNNYYLPWKYILEEYEVVPIEYDENEINMEKNENNNNNLFFKKTLDLFCKKKYMEEKLINIDKYFIRGMNSKPKIDEFLSANPFYGFNNRKIKKNVLNVPVINIENINEEINNNEIYTFKNSSIGNIEHFINLLYKYKKYNNNEEEKKENKLFMDKVDIFIDLINKKIEKYYGDINIGRIFVEKEVFFYRSVLNDGNSFFRAFLFGLLETYILENNIRKFKNFISLVSNSFFLDIYSENEKDIETEAQISKLEKIGECLKNNKVKDALKLLYDSFSLNNNLDKFLINFLKIILCFSKKIKKNNIYLQSVEFEFIDLFFLSFIFEITLEISFDINMGKNKFCIFDTYKKNNIRPLLQLCFYKNNTFIYYDIDKYLKLVKCNMIPRYENLPKINKIIYKLDIKINCKICQKETTHIALIEKYILICEKCLIQCKDKYLKNRIDILKSSNLYKDILFKSLTIQKNKYYLDDYEYLHLFDDYLIDSIQKKFVDYIQKNNYYFCAKCLNISDNRKQMKCGCFYCTGCLDEIIKKMTDEEIILNQYEKNNLGKIRCMCGKNMDILSIIEEKEKSIDENDEKYKLMIERLNKYISSFCMNCECKIISFNNEDDHQIIISGNKNKNIKENHILCKNCYKNINLKKNNQVLFCKICSENHKVENEIII